MNKPNHPEPFAAINEFFSDWERLKILLYATTVWTIIMIGVSSSQATYIPGAFSNLVSNTGGVGNPFGDFETFCKAQPYAYLRPFAFTMEQSTTLNGTTYKNADSAGVASQCPWPLANTGSRVTVEVFSLLSIGLLLFETILSDYAHIVLGIFTFLFWTIFVLDANAAITGYNTSSNKFINTNFAVLLGLHGVSIEPDYHNYNGFVIMDIIQAVLVSLIFGAWDKCNNLYGAVAPGAAKKFDAIDNTGDAGGNIETDEDLEGQDDGEYQDVELDKQ